MSFGLKGEVKPLKLPCEPFESSIEESNILLEIKWFDKKDYSIN